MQAEMVGITSTFRGVAIYHISVVKNIYSIFHFHVIIFCEITLQINYFTDLKTLIF